MAGCGRSLHSLLPTRSSTHTLRSQPTASSAPFGLKTRAVLEDARQPVEIGSSSCPVFASSSRTMPLRLSVAATRNPSGLNAITRCPTLPASMSLCVGGRRHSTLRDSSGTTRLAIARPSSVCAERRDAAARYAARTSPSSEVSKAWRASASSWPATATSRCRRASSRCPTA